MIESNIARNSGEEFQYYVERQFKLLYNREIQNNIEFSHQLGTLNNNLHGTNERLDKMTTLAEELGVEETTLSEVIPALATELTTLQTTLAEKEAALNTAANTLAADSAELTANRAELAAIQAVQAQLAPLVEKAKTLVPAPVTTPPVETPPIETPVTPENPITNPPTESPETPGAEQPIVTEAPTTPVEQPATPPAETGSGSV